MEMRLKKASPCAVKFHTGEVDDITFNIGDRLALEWAIDEMEIFPHIAHRKAAELILVYIRMRLCCLSGLNGVGIYTNLLLLLIGPPPAAWRPRGL